MNQLIDLKVMLLAFILLSPSLEASRQVYSPDLQESRWSSQGNRLKCSLEQSIPGYGTGVFRMRAGGALEFQLGSSESRRNPGKGELFAMGPEWIHDRQASEQKFEASVIRGRMPLRMDETASLWMLEVLKRGDRAGFLLPPDGKLKPEQQVQLNPVGFQKAYREFSDCLDALLPYTFEAIQRTELHFPTRSANLSDAMKAELDRIVNYLKADPGNYRVSIAGHTDNIASRSFNQALSVKRAQAVENYLKQRGLTQVAFKSRGYGETRPSKSNRKAAGRAANRRVEIRISR